MRTSGPELLRVLAALSNADVPAWVDGGWGIDALLGAQHRVHADADLVVRLSDVDLVVDCLLPLGYLLSTDLRPTRVVLTTVDERQVDLHPVTFDADGTGWQAGAGPDGTDARYPAEAFTTGLVDGHPVRCLSADLQVAHHTGYPPQGHDREDLARLADRFGVRLPAEYG